MKITAEEARALSGPSVEDHVNEVYPAIRKAAEQKWREIRLHDDFWTQGGYSGTADWKRACDLLRADGFKVEFFYEERQFVNMYTKVSW